LHNTPSHGGEPYTLGPPPCEEVLYNCCDGVVNPSFSFLKGLAIKTQKVKMKIQYHIEMGLIHNKNIIENAAEIF
jgi:hypothetical protein